MIARFSGWYGRFFVCFIFSVVLLIAGQISDDSVTRPHLVSLCFKMQVNDLIINRLSFKVVQCLFTDLMFLVLSEKLHNLHYWRDKYIINKNIFLCVEVFTK